MDNTYYLHGFDDGFAVARRLSPADIRARLDAATSMDDPSHAIPAYQQGYRDALRAGLARTQVRRGQGGCCQGTLRIALSGPQGAGKSMVKKFLECIMPLLPVQRFVIDVEETDGD